MKRHLLHYKALDYKIKLYEASLDVRGYAVSLPKPLDWIHICVRMWAPGDWTIDHYETGVGIVGPVWPVTAVLDTTQRALVRRYPFNGRTRDSAVRSAIRWMLYLNRKGILRPKIERAMRGDAA